MISIRTREILNSIAEIQRYRAELAAVREQAASLTAGIRSQSYTDSTQYRLWQLQKRLQGIEETLQQFAGGLEEICVLAERTESRVVDIYESEQPVRMTAQLGCTTVNLNPNISSILQISWR